MKICIEKFLRYGIIKLVGSLEITKYILLFSSASEELKKKKKEGRKLREMR